LFLIKQQRSVWGETNADNSCSPTYQKKLRKEYVNMPTKKFLNSSVVDDSSPMAINRAYTYVSPQITPSPVPPSPVHLNKETSELSHDYFEPIYSGSDITVLAANCAIMKYASENNLEYNAISNLLQLLYLLCTNPNKLPTSHYKIKHFLSSIRCHPAVVHFVLNVKILKQIAVVQEFHQQQQDTW